MISLKSLSHVMVHPTVYRLWQMPFVEAKLRPLRQHNDLSHPGRVLDIGCGPGTNAGMFPAANYCGLDINPAYVAYARQRFGGQFEAVDVRQWAPPAEAHYDFVLLNSLLHHLDSAATRQILERARDVLAPQGHVHIVELVLPEQASIARWLARNDRGDFPRSVDEWRAIFSSIFESVVFEPFPVGAGSLALWQMVYFKGRARP
jgi:SAM-dependent methyltransferase